MKTSPIHPLYVSSWRAFPSGWLSGSTGQLLRQTRPSVPPWSCYDFEEDSAFFPCSSPLLLKPPFFCMPDQIKYDKIVCRVR